MLLDQLFSCISRVSWSGLSVLPGFCRNSISPLSKPCSLDLIICIESKQCQSGQPATLSLAARRVDDDLSIIVDLIDPEA